MATSYSFTPEQLKAVKLAFSSRVSLVTGGPGTGKTTLITAMVEAAKRSQQSVLLIAPTGKAASRITSHVGEPASTVHRALGWHPETGEPVFNQGDPWPSDLVICDEASMLDTFLSAKLFAAVRRDARIVLVGDANQIPPVSPGAVFRDLLDSGKVPTTSLETSFRQTEGSAIHVAARKVLAGVTPTNSKAIDQESSFFFLPREPENVVSTVTKLVAESIPKALGVSSDNDIQVLSPAREGMLGVSGLNSGLVQVFNPGAHQYRLSLGDKVLHIKNNYDLGVFNGDTGRIVDASGDSTSVEYVLPDGNSREVGYTNRLLSQLVRAYAVTIHKSQGSEFEVVVIVLSNQHGRLLYRNLLYTAITRARRLCVVVGSEAAYRKCIVTPQASRETNLRHYLDEATA